MKKSRAVWIALVAVTCLGAYSAMAAESDEDASASWTPPDWLKDLTFYGDLRLRYQGESLDNGDQCRQRGRFRLRFGVKKTFLEDQMEVGFRLASGSDTDPTSTNQTFDDQFSKKSIWIDRAYARFEPDTIAGFTIIGGKMGNPLVHTDMIWDSDVNPEGVWAQYKFADNVVRPFFNIGYFILDEISDEADATLATYQAGLDWDVDDDVTVSGAATYYYFNRYATNYRTANGNHEMGGMLLAEHFYLLDLTGSVAFKAFDLPIKVWGDFVKNLGDDDNTAGYRNKDTGYAAGVKVGKNKKAGDWSCGYKYAHIEANATPGALNDSDFFGSDRQGHVVSTTYNLLDSLTVGAAVYCTEPITASGGHDLLGQLDLVWTF